MPPLKKSACESFNCYQRHPDFLSSFSRLSNVLKTLASYPRTLGIAVVLSRIHLAAAQSPGTSDIWTESSQVQKILMATIVGVGLVGATLPRRRFGDEVLLVTATTLGAGLCWVATDTTVTTLQQIVIAATDLALNETLLRPRLRGSNRTAALNRFLVTLLGVSSAFGLSHLFPPLARHFASPMNAGAIWSVPFILFYSFCMAVNL